MLFAARTSSAKMRANQLRLFFSSIAYVLLQCYGGWVFTALNWPELNATQFG